MAQDYRTSNDTRDYLRIVAVGTVTDIQNTTVRRLVETSMGLGATCKMAPAIPDLAKNAPAGGGQKTLFETGPDTNIIRLTDAEKTQRPSAEQVV